MSRCSSNWPRCWRRRGSSMGCVVVQKWRRMVSDGSRFRSGTSSLSLRQERSSRHMRGGSQANPPSISTTFNPGNRSNTPSVTRLITCA